MNLAELRNRLNWLLHFNPTQADQAFAGESANDTYKHIDYLLNASGREEIRLGQLVRRGAYKARYVLSWPTSATTVDIPALLRGAQILHINDVTDSDTVGTLVPFNEEFVAGVNGWYQYSTTQWGQYPAPGSARTYNVIYLARWVDLRNPADVPGLIPEDLHDLLLWSAAVLGRTVADESPPAAWLKQRDELRQQYHFQLAKGVPMIYPPTVLNLNPDLTEAI